MSTLKKHTIPHLLEYAFSHYRDKKGFSFVDGEQQTFASLEKQITSIANTLKNKGVKQHDKVAILAVNSPDWVAAYFAITAMGAVVVPILPDFTKKEAQWIMEHSEAKAVFVSQKTYPKALDLSIPIFKLENLAPVPEGTALDDYSKLPEPQLDTSEFTYADVQENDLLSIIYTSGTTGSSKGVMLSHKNVMWNLEKCKEIQPISEKDRFLSILPLSHSYENTVGMMTALMSGSATYYISKLPTPTVLLASLAKVKPTIMLSVPLIIEKVYRGKVMQTINSKRITRIAYKFAPFRKLLNNVAGKKLYQSFGGHLQFFGIGGSKLDPTVEQFLQDSKFPYAIGYGMTETSPLIAGALVGETKVGSTGPVISGLQMRLVKQSPKDKTGEVQVKGPSVMMGYYKNEKQTKEAFTDDGWLRTGDLAKLDKKGNVFIKGRIKTMIVGASGENIYPEEIESVINKMDLVLESLVTQRGGKLVAMVHLNMEELERRMKNLKENVATMKSDAMQRKEDATKAFEEKVNEILDNIHCHVNQELNKFSQIQQMVLQPVPFEKTPTQKVKRFLYK